MGARYIPIIIQVTGGNSQTIVKGLEDAFKSLDSAAEQAGSGGLKNAFVQADLMARGLALLTREVMDCAREYLQFGREIANLDTLLGANDHVEKLRDGLLNLDPALGSTTDLARGMYQAISSGVDAGDSLKFIESSAKAARAGLATTFETVDAGTAVMASFGLKAKDIDSVYDKMFETVKRGKVEMPQLASSIGLVSNIAAQSGVSVAEMFAAIATGTRTNRPAIAIEGFRTALSNILKPSQEATQLAHSLGLQFDGQALKAKGLAKFLEDVSKATGGSTEKMVKLFGDVQALNFVLSVTGNQANTFAEDLKGVSAATGTVDEAFTKQRQSLGSEMDAFKVTIQQDLMKAFSLAEPVATGLLKVLIAYPGILRAAAVAAGALTIAIGIYNATQIASSLGLATLIKGLKDVVFWMFHFQTAMTSFQTGATAAAGWIGLAVAVGFLVYQLTKTVPASEAAKDITLEGIEAQRQAIATTTELAAEAASLTDSQKLSAEQHAKLNEILGKLEPSTVAYLNSVEGEKQRVDALNRSLAERLGLEKTLLEAKLRTLVGAVLEENKAIEEQRAIITRNEASIRTWMAALSLGPEYASDARTNIDKLSAGIVDADGKIADLSGKLSTHNIEMVAAAKAANHTREQFIGFITTADRSKNEIELLISTWDRLTKTQNEGAQATKENTSAIDKQAEALKHLKEVQDSFTHRKELIEAATIDIAQNAKSAADAKRQLAEQRKQNPELDENIKKAQQIAENQRALSEVIDPLKHQRTSDDPIVQLNREIPKLRKEVNALKAGGGQLFDLQVQKEELDSTKKQLTEILQLRRTLKQNEGDFLPSDQAGRDKELRDLGREKQTREAITKILDSEAEARDALRIAQAKAAAPVVSKETRVATGLATETQSRRDQVMQTAADIELTEGRLSSRMHDRIALVNEAAEVERLGWLKRQDAAEASLITEQGREKTLTDAVRNGSAARKVILSEALAAQDKERNNADETILQNEYFLKVGLIGFDQDLALARSEDNKQRVVNERETTKQIALINENLAELRANDADAIAEAVNAANLSRKRSEAQTLGDLAVMREQEQAGYLRSEEFVRSVHESTELSRRQASATSATKIIELQDEIAHAGEGAADRFRIAWLEANLEIRQADEAAVISQIKSRARIADATVFHEQQANAKILEFFAQQKSVTDTIADAKIGLMQKTFDGVDAALDRIIPKMHGFGSLVKQILGDLIKMAASKFFMKLFGLEPAENSESAHASGGASGGGILGNLRNMFSGGGSEQGSGGGGIFGTFRNLFKGGGQGSSGGGGFLGGLKNLIGLGGGGAAATPSFAGAAASGGGGLAALAGGGANAFAAPSAIAAIGGGGAAAGAGASGAAAAGTAGGASGFGALVPLLTNPWTIGIAAAAIGGILLWRHFRNGTEKKLREGIKGTYGVDVKDMSTLKQIKEYGESIYGKGNVSRHIGEVLKDDQVKQMIQSYAEQTGQGTGKVITNAQYQDPSFAGNRFVKRITGGPIPGMSRGFDHVPVLADGGEFMLRRDVVAAHGLSAVAALNNGQATIAPRGKLLNVAMPTSQADSDGQATGGGGGPRYAELHPNVQATLDRLTGALETFERASPEGLVMKGLPKNGPLLASTFLDEHGRNPKVNDRFQRQAGNTKNG